MYFQDSLARTIEGYPNCHTQLLVALSEEQQGAIKLQISPPGKKARMGEPQIGKALKALTPECLATAVTLLLLFSLVSSMV